MVDTESVLHTVKLSKRDKVFLLNLQDQVESRKLNPADLFDEFDKNKDGGLAWGEFGDLLRNKLQMDENFGQNFVHVFKKADINNDDKLQREEFLSIFKWSIDVRTLEQQQELIEKIKALEDIVQGKQGALDALQGSNKEHQADLEKKDSQITSLSEENENLKKKIKELEEQITSLKGESEQQKTKIQEQENNIQEINKQKDGLQNQLDNKNKELEERNKEIEKLKSDLNQSNEQLKKYKLENKKLIEQIHELIDKLNLFQSQFNSVQEQLSKQTPIIPSKEGFQAIESEITLIDAQDGQQKQQ